jgi:hypothetical protein
MTLALLAFVAAAALPVFFARLRSAPAWLLLQAAALAWASMARHGEPDLHAFAALAELLLVRGLVAPLLLRRAIREHGGQNVELMPGNLFVWAIAIGLIALAFQFGVTGGDPHALVLGAVAATVTVALLLLATSDRPPAQLVAVLFIESAIALFETTLPEPWPTPVHLALSAVYLLTVAVGAWLIAQAGPRAEAARQAAEGGGAS